jgi:hypothetical protein
MRTGQKYSRNNFALECPPGLNIWRSSVSSFGFRVTEFDERPRGLVAVATVEGRGGRLFRRVQERGARDRGEALRHGRKQPGLLEQEQLPAGPAAGPQDCRPLLPRCGGLMRAGRYRRPGFARPSFNSLGALQHFAAEEFTPAGDGAPHFGVENLALLTSIRWSGPECVAEEVEDRSGNIPVRRLGAFL